VGKGLILKSCGEGEYRAKGRPVIGNYPSSLAELQKGARLRGDEVVLGEREILSPPIGEGDKSKSLNLSAMAGGEGGIAPTPCSYKKRRKRRF